MTVHPPALTFRRLPQGVVAILASVFGMALADAIFKHASADMSLWQIWVMRSAMVLPVMFIMARGRVWHPAAGAIALRSLALIGMYLAMYPALPFIDMSLAGAAFYTAPLFIAGLSALVLGNRITRGHWLAILTGFVGLLVIVRPFAASFTPVVFLPVTAAAFYACAAILTRARCHQVAPVVLGFWLNVAFLLTGGLALAWLSLGLPRPAVDFPFLLATWRPLLPEDWRNIALLAVLILGVAIGVAKAYQSPQPEVIATFDYCYMIFAIFWGYVFFREVPDLWTLVGMSLIAAGGLAVLAADAAARRA